MNRLLLALVAAAVLSAPAAGQMQEVAPQAPPAYGEDLVSAERARVLLDDALRSIIMTRADLSFRTDYADEPDSFRLTIADSLLANPLDTEHYVYELAGRMGDCATLADLASVAARELDIDAPPAGRVGEDPLEVLLDGIRSANALIDSAFAPLSPDERAFIAEHAPALLEEEEFDPDKPIDVRDRENELESEMGDELLRVAALVDYERIARAGTALSSAIDAGLVALEEWDWSALGAGGDAPATAGAWDGDVLIVLETDVGTVVVGGPGPTVYRGQCALSIDVGGDDLYLGRAAGAEPGSGARVAIDLKGNDSYLTGAHSSGAGFMGAGALIDLEGDDVYVAGNFSQGAGLFGFGMLDDRSGNDRYVGDTCTQGSGAFGLGVLVEREGNDSYEAALFSQAFGFVKGIGVLVERAGNDTYFAGGKYTDEIRYFDHYLSLSQGFAYGWRPDASGGVALLFDSSGNDVYVSDIFGQGSSYWFAVAGLVDGAGNDQYVSYQYAQGAGTHITVAALVDVEGDDNYVSKGVSQGCGHDLAIGMLHDLSGDDSYTCHDLSQGAGNANGIGFILDDAGDDAYSVRNPDNTNGYGNHRRDYGSVGLHIDCGGTDSYAGRGADGAWWVGSDRGIGIDFNVPEPTEPGKEDSE